MTTSKICKKIKEHRTKKGMTQKELANALFMDERNYAKFERGQKKSIDVFLLQSIADVLKINILELLYKKEENIKEEENISLNSNSSSIDDLKNCIFQIKKDLEAVLAEQRNLKETIQSFLLQIKSLNGTLVKD